MSKPLTLRDVDYRTLEIWARALELLAGHPDPGAATALHNIRGITKLRRNPPLIHNGGKP